MDTRLIYSTELGVVMDRKNDLRQLIGLLERLKDVLSAKRKPGDPVFRQVQKKIDEHTAALAECYMKKES